MYYTVYKITNKINSRQYIGVHKTVDLEDGYMGSGRTLKNHQKKYGLEYFEKEILFNFDNPEEMYKKEKELVNGEYVSRKDTYNLKEGGHGGWDHCKGMVTVKDKDDNTFNVSIDDERYVSEELVGVTKNTIVVKDEAGNKFRVDKDDKRYLSGELIQAVCGTTIVKDEVGSKIRVSVSDKRILSGEFTPIWKDTTFVKNKDGESFRVSIHDERYISGELVGITKGIKYKVKNRKKEKNKKCPHCPKEGIMSNMKRWHFDNCKLK